MTKIKLDNEKLKPNILSNPFWSWEVGDVAKKLSTDSERGINEKEAEKRLSVFGVNRFGEAKNPPFFYIFIKQFYSPLIVILLIASVITLAIREFSDTAVIMLAVIVNTALGFYQENKASRVIAGLSSYLQDRARVVRGEFEQEINAYKLVPGDLIHISEGMRIPADARVVSSQNLSVDEAILTGESTPVIKSPNSISEAAIVTERKNMVFGGTLVTEGTGHAIVTATGTLTEIGKLAKLVMKTRQEKTPLQKTVASLSWIIALVASLVVGGLFAIGVSRGEPIFEMLIISIAVVVGAIPEALPIGLTAVLAVGIQQIAKHKGIVRNLAASETLGSTTVLMVDKTGTLTEAKMKLADIFTAKELILKNNGIQDVADGATDSEKKEILKLATANIDITIENPNENPEKWIIGGRPLETSIAREAALKGIDIHNKNFKNKKRVILNFSSALRFSLVETKNHIVALGAPDLLLKKSALNKNDYVAISEQIEKMSQNGYRLLGVAALRHGNSENNFDSGDPESLKNLSFKGILAFKDPVRENITETLKKINQYGLKIVMATGDLKGTAVSVAKEIGWEIKEGEVLTGEELRRLKDKEITKELPRIKIFARVTPEDKLRIVGLYKNRGEVVAMTGDGVNDAPSLKAANIGVTVGSGSDVAKEVADLVLLDDKLSTIVAAIEEGKRMILNIRKIFVYLMSNAMDEVILIGGSLVAGIALPLSAAQIIWVNLFTGSLPAIAFAFEKDGDFVSGKKDKSAIIDGEVKFIALGIGALTSVLLLILYWLLVRFSDDINIARSVLFACFASYVLIIAFSLRRLKRSIFSYSVFENKLLVAAALIGLILTTATVYLPKFQNFFGTVAIPPVWLFLVLGWLAFNIFLIEAVKRLFYDKSKTR